MCYRVDRAFLDVCVDPCVCNFDATRAPEYSSSEDNPDLSVCSTQIRSIDMTDDALGPSGSSQPEECSDACIDNWAEFCKEERGELPKVIRSAKFRALLVVLFAVRLPPL